MKPNAAGHTLAARFSAAAATYDRHAVIQRRVAARVAELAAAQPGVRRVLEIGCGTGLLTERLAEVLPAAELCAIDLSPAMIERARARLADCSRVTWIIGDALALVAAEPFDLIVSSSSLHWFDCPGRLFRKLHELLCDGGRMVFELMLEGTLAELHAARQRVASGKPVPARLPRREQVLAALRTASFEVLGCSREQVRLEYPSAREFLESLHEQGLTGGPVSRASVPLNRGELKALVTDYAQHYGNARGTVTATYETLIVTAAKQGP